MGVNATQIDLSGYFLTIETAMGLELLNIIQSTVLWIIVIGLIEDILFR